MRRPFFNSTILASLLCLSACGPKIISNVSTSQPLPATIAVLPADYSVDIPRERVDIARKALIQELRNQDFFVVEDSVVQRLCSSPRCPEMRQLSDRYLVDGFISLKLSSFSRNNFIAGYYNQLSGEVLVADRDGRELVRVKHNENERGGVLLESGQIFQGIISQRRQSGEGGFENLAEKFAQTAVQSLPPHATDSMTTRQEALEVSLSSASATWSSPRFFKVCAKGTPHSFAFLHIDTVATSLREVAPGEYCSAFSPVSTFSPGAQTFVELKSAFGTSARQAVTLPVTPPCSLENRITVTEAPKDLQLTVSCARIGADTSRRTVGCSAAVTQCQAEKLVVFKAAPLSGAFTKVAEVRRSSARLQKASDAQLTIVAVQPGGIYSQATPLTGVR
jgi:hypothetical protein